MPGFRTPQASIWALKPMGYICILVWAPCLMHRCVCIWRYILQNYNYKLHFQDLSIYHIPHVSTGTLATENLDVCTACDLWDTADHGRRLETGAGHAFPRQRHMRRKGGGVYLFLPGFSSLYDAIHGWVTGRMDGKSFTTTRSFTICNNPP
jgi:hypothetical protein